MHLLLSNDDGYQAIGIRTLAREAARRGHKVFVSAPLTEKSAASHFLTLSHPLMARPVPFDGIDAYAVDGSPVDCVRVARYLADAPFDFCISGINHGENVGTGIIYSGTDAAAREAVMGYLPAIAVSVEYRATQEIFQKAAETALDMAEHLVKNPMPRFTFCNINVPAVSPESIKGIRLSTVSDSFYTDGYVQRRDPLGRPYFWMELGGGLEEPLEGTDLHNLKQGYITVTYVGGYADRNNASPALPY